ncbi:MAG: hypothetical protein AB3N33_05235 [Puniceicoccaceae bacterium]
MTDIVQLLIILLLYFPVTVLINRLQLTLFPVRKSLPAQGTIARSAIFALVLLLVFGGLVLGQSMAAKVLWLFYTFIILGCLLLLYISVMCVSESGRRFYFMLLVEQADDGITREELQAAYGKQHMLSVRLERLCTWGVFVKSGSSYVLRRQTAYWYSRFFHLWGSLLGFKWFQE